MFQRELLQNANENRTIQFESNLQIVEIVETMIQPYHD